jgi:uncharacterized protein YkwD
MLRSARPGLVAAVCLIPLAIAAPEAQPADTACDDADLVPANDNLGRIGASITCLINAARADDGDPALESAAELRVPGQGMSDDMVERKFFSHRTPEGAGVADRIRPTGYLPDHNRWVVGENLGWGSGSLATPRAMVRGWMNSPEHRANILAPDYEDIGVGLTMGSPTTDREGGTTFAIEFGTRDRRPSISVPSQLDADAERAADEGVSYRAECSRPCTLRARLIGRRTGDSRPVELARGRLRLRVGGTGTMTVDLDRDAARSPRRLAGADLRLITRATGWPVARITRLSLH